ncbi:hypothetical protein HKX48_006487 [Thoreauomyces humboldtii]|nr:hypothetical protein HKX48_006487 [Thoreauomyces humboldtii]
MSSVSSQATLQSDGTTTSSPATPSFGLTSSRNNLVQAHITILRLLVASALLFALIPVLALAAALLPPPIPAVISLVSAGTIFPTATITLWLAVKRMRAEELRVRWAADQLEMGAGAGAAVRGVLPTYVDVEPLPAYEPKLELLVPEAVFPAALEDEEVGLDANDEDRLL